MDHAEYCDNEECQHSSHNQFEGEERHNAWCQRIRSSAPVLAGDHSAGECPPRRRRVE